MTKLCKDCGEVKAFTDFSAIQSNKDGRSSTCKKCVCLRNQTYYRTPEGRAARIFTTQLSSSVARGHPNPAYSKKEFLNWAATQGMAVLCLPWKASGYSKNLTPSVDRIDPNKPYSLDNIRLVTWKENNDKAYEDRKKGLHITKQNCRVLQLTLDGQLIKEFSSISAAARETNVCRTAINSVCLNKYVTPHVGGFMWQFL